MTSKAEIRRQIKENIAKQNALRSDAAIKVAEAWQEVEDLRAQTSAAESALAEAVAEAQEYMSLSELRAATGISKLPAAKARSSRSKKSESSSTDTRPAKLSAVGE